MKPGQGYTTSRVRDAERQLAASDRSEVQQGRLARPVARRAGIHRAITVDIITHATAGTVKLFYWDGTKYRQSRNPSDGTEVTVEAWCCILNEADTIDANTVCIVQHIDDNTWEIISAYCDARDWVFTEDVPSGLTGEESPGDLLAVGGDNPVFYVPDDSYFIQLFT